MVRERLRRRLGRPDASIASRAVTAACVMVSVAAAVNVEAVDLGPGILALLLVPAGFVISYVRRAERNVAIKIVLTAGLFIAFASFIGTVRFATSVDDTRTPLVGLFLWVQVLHSFDVPRPRDLSFSIAAAVVLIALAGSLAFSTGFLAFVVLFAILLIAALALSHRDELAATPERSGGANGLMEPTRRMRVERGPVVAVGRRFVTVGAATLVCTALVFVFLPRFPVRQIAQLPFTAAQRASIPGFVGNVAVPGAQRGETASERAFDPDTYFGYGQNLDLRVRGRLSDELVMRVRASRPSLYRGEVYDMYSPDGRWTSSDEDLEERSEAGLGAISIPEPPEEQTTQWISSSDLVQTFYVERELPNILFHAYRAHEVYVWSTTVRVDDFSSIRIPATLEQDTIYSVVSKTPDISPDVLRQGVQALPPNVEFSRYLQVPPSLGGRFTDLARRITAQHELTADKAQAVEDWLHSNKKYRLDISRDPPGRDPVDVFTFDRKEGFCEQIAATMALMLRASGVPTRIVVGFGEGNRNLFTGYWEIRSSDAHAWVEVFYPDFGWVPYDPTFGVPLANAGNTTFMFAPLRRLADAVFPDDALRSVVSALGSLVRAAPLVAALVLLLLVAALSLGAVRVTRIVRNRGRPPDDVGRAWLDLERTLRRRGIRRERHETAREFAARASAALGRREISDVAERFGEARYGQPSEELRTAFAQRATELTRSLRARRN